MKKVYLLMAFCVVVSCKKRDNWDDAYMNTDSISTDTTYQASTPVFNDSTSIILQCQLRQQNPNTLLYGLL